jgi:hypothetical protein
MNAFIFVGIVCIGSQCDFTASSRPVTQEQCQEMKTQFLNLPFKPSVTMAAAQCMQFEGEVNNKVTI